MASRYKFSEEQIKEIEQTRKDNKDKRAEAKMKTIQYPGSHAPQAPEPTDQEAEGD